MIEPLPDQADHRWRRVDTGEILTMAEMPVGAMWFAPWLCGANSRYKEPPLIVKTPGGDWNIDSRASNCTKPEDNEHRCWCRHGEPPNVTVDKNGLTCGCGCSIGFGENWSRYHGFLRNGELTPA